MASYWVVLVAVALSITIASGDVSSNGAASGKRPGGPPRPGRFLSLPVPNKCSQRPKEFFFRGHNYFYSESLPQLRGKRLDWLDARNACREYCMDLVSIETNEENDLVFKLIQQRNSPYIWTSGRLCDFKGCENRRDLEPKNIYGWFWSGTRGKMSPTNQSPPGFSTNPWSQTGHERRPQPDNAEFRINQTPESCLAVLHNVYGDGVKWHDVACYHEKPFICEDSEELLNYVAQKNPGIPL
ncbi:hypothetical protein J437_LFUL000095 [Ladona fulva]|uniref:C-type lectin domain-containing protein n=1 Tax=Ladona fulva TaxID=123851 RepID=A0A8K0P0F5_LADFU|nr:hypothetical protein J437_LFUL000095 [Ladona fulva]